MKVAKKKLQKKEEIKEVVESYTIKNMIAIVISICIVFAIFYVITTFVVKDNNKIQNNSNNVAVIDSTKIVLSQLLNRKEKEYYVIATKNNISDNSYIDSNYLSLYNNYINDYKAKENSIPFYYVNLDDALNKNYLSSELKITNEIKELRLNDEVLFKIKEGKIEESFVGSDNILKYLSSLLDEKKAD